MTEIEAIEQGFARLALVLSMPQEKKLWNAEASCKNQPRH